MIPVGAMVGFLGASWLTYMMPKKYESSATIEINSIPNPSLDGSVSPAYQGTQFGKMTSRNTLLRVVDALDLTNKWATDRDSVVRILRQVITAENIRGTDLYTIKARHTNREDARDIVAETARAFRDTLTEEADEELSGTIIAYKKAVREQEDRVEERRKVLTTITRSFGLERDGVSEPPTHEDFIDLKREVEVEQDLLKELKLKLVAAEIDADIRQDVIVVHDDPLIPDAPISPNVTLNLMIGLAGGALLSPFLALPLMWMMNRKHIT